VKNSVSVKVRLGFNEDISNQIIEKFDDCEIIIHGRYVTDEYRGHARLDHLPDLERIVYNGDIKTLEQVEKHKRVMIGRGIYGNPELLTQLQGKEISKTKEEILSLQFDMLEKFYDNERIKLNLAKKHALWTLKDRRLDIINAESLDDLRKLLFT